MAGRPLSGRASYCLVTTARAVAGRSLDDTKSMERLMLAMGAVLRRPEMVMGTYGSEGSGGQGVSGFVSNVLLRGGPKSELLCGGQCGAAAACVLPVRLSTAMSTAELCGAVLLLSAAAWLPAPHSLSFTS